MVARYNMRIGAWRACRREFARCFARNACGAVASRRRCFANCGVKCCIQTCIYFSRERLFRCLNLAGALRIGCNVIGGNRA